MTLKNTDDTNAVFTIKNSQDFGDHNDCLEIKTAGKYYLRNGKYYIIYTEYSDIGEVSVLVKVEGEKVKIKRSGACRAIMNYEKNTHDEVLYQLEYGNIVLELFTNDVVNNLDENGGQLLIEYDILMSGEGYSNKLLIEVEANKKGTCC